MYRFLPQDRLPSYDDEKNGNIADSKFSRWARVIKKINEGGGKTLSKPSFIVSQ